MGPNNSSNSTERERFRQPPDGRPTGLLTPLARVLVAFYLVAAFGGIALYIALTYDELPPGVYPIWLFALPVFVGLFVVGAIALAILQACGVPIYRKPESHDHSSDSGDQQQRSSQQG